jgi:hypothetical protein
MAEKKVTNQAAIDAARRAEAERPAKLAEQQAKLPVVKEALSTAQSGAKTKTADVIFNKALAGLPSSYNKNTDVAKGMAAMSARYGLEAAARNVYTGENIGYNISEQTKAEQGDVTNTENLINLYGTPVNIPGAIYGDSSTTGKNSAYDLLLAQFKLYGLEALITPLQNLITDDTSEGELTIMLRETPAYQKRFAANKTRIAAGLSAINEAEYLGMEDKYQSIMRNYGLPESYYAKGDLGRQEGFEKLIGFDVSATELEDRIMTAQQRVINAAPEVTAALKQFYPDIKNGEILAYTLDPSKGLLDIKRKITAAEIGGAALGVKTTAGETLTTGMARAEELARYGVTAETARAGYGAIGGGLERGRQLSSIYQQPDYNQAVAEEEIFNLPGQTQAGEKRKKIIGLEKATFGGQTGVTSGALSQNRAGSY